MFHPFVGTLRLVCSLRNTTPEELVQRSGYMTPELIQDILHWKYQSFSPDVIDWLADALDLTGYQRRAFFEAAYIPLSEQGNRLFYRVFTQLCQEQHTTLTQVSLQAGLSPMVVQGMLDGEWYPTGECADKVERLADAFHLQNQDRLMFLRSGGFDPIDIREEDDDEEDDDEKDDNDESPDIPQEPLRIFYCYAHQDQKLREALDKHLMLLKHMGIATTWHDREIQAGTDWQQEITTKLLTAHLILLLISPDFMASDYCYSIEMQQALALHHKRYATVIPISLRPVDYRGAPFAQLSFLPINRQAVTSATWRNRDEALYHIATNIRAIIEQRQGEEEEE